jgi:hypothetical protein
MDILSHDLSTTKDLLTSRSGLICIAQMMEKIGFCEAVDQYFPTPKSNRGYQPSVFVTPLILMFQEGGRSLDDLRHLRRDEALRLLLGMEKFPESDSVGDWLRRLGQEGVSAVTEVNRLVLQKSLHNCKAATLDIDATLSESKNKSAQWTYKKCKGYMPMVGHIAQTGQVVATEFREGNVAPASNNLQFIHRCEAALPAGVTISAVRIDAAGYQAEILDMCIHRDLKFAIRAKMSPSLKKEIQSHGEEQWQPLLDAQGCPIENQSTLRLVHTMEKSQNAFTLIVQRCLIKGQQEMDLEDLDDQETLRSGAYLYRAIAVSPDLALTDSQWVHWYNQRGEHSENRIKELKADFAADRVPCQNFDANALYFSLCALAYNLFALFRMFLPACFESTRAKTIRWRIFALAGKVVRHGRKLCLKLKQAHHDLLKDILQRLSDLSLAP